MKYQRLTQRDTIREGDEYYTNWGTWTEIETEFIDKRKGAVFGWYVKMRRPLTNKDCVLGCQQMRAQEGGNSRNIF
jgi:hypothetical protein